MKKRGKQKEGKDSDKVVFRLFTPFFYCIFFFLFFFSFLIVLLLFLFSLLFSFTPLFFSFFNPSKKIGFKKVRKKHETEKRE